MVAYVSIHAPMKGATYAFCITNLFIWSFNPRTHEGCDCVFKTCSKLQRVNGLFRDTLPRLTVLQRKLILKTSLKGIVQRFHRSLGVCMITGDSRINTILLPRDHTLVLLHSVRLYFSNVYQENSNVSYQF